MYNSRFTRPNLTSGSKMPGIQPALPVNSHAAWSVRTGAALTAVALMSCLLLNSVVAHAQGHVHTRAQVAGQDGEDETHTLDSAHAQNAFVNEIGDLGQAAASINLSAGTFGVTGHACSEPIYPPGPLGYSSFFSFSDFSERLSLTSDTVPIGTPVDVEFKFMVGTQRHIRVRSFPIRFTSSVGIGGEASFVAHYTDGTGIRAGGKFGLSPDGDKITSSGLLSDDPDLQMQTLTLTGVPVGQQITFDGGLSLSGGMLAMIADVDAQLAGVWGARCSTLGVSLISGSTGSPSPTWDNVTPDAVNGAYVPFPVALPTAVPEPVSLALLLVGVASLAATRRGRRVKS